jgi:hypothetical protein
MLTDGWNDRHEMPSECSKAAGSFSTSIGHP